MKYGFYFVLTIGLILGAYQAAQNKIATSQNLNALRLGMTVRDIETNFGTPSAHSRNQFTYILDDGSELVITLRDEKISSAKVKFHKEVKIQDPEMKKLSLVQMDMHDIESNSPSWFFAGKLTNFFKSKKKSRIYIMPTRMGGYLNGLIFLMFLLSVGYSNNLLLIFTLFLFGLNLIWVIQTHYHLHALKLDSVSVSDGFALENSVVEVFWKKTPEIPHKWNLRLFGEDFDLRLNSLENSQTKSLSGLVFPKRGVWHFQHLRVATEMPFGLYKAWIYFPIEAKGYAYPAKLKDSPHINLESNLNDGEFASSRPGPHDVWNLGPYQGEESRRISWKHYARTGELVVKEGEEFSNAIVHFRLPVTNDNKEYILSKLATQMVQCSKTDVPFSFENKSASLTAKHLTDCLRELSQC